VKNVSMRSRRTALLFCTAFVAQAQAQVTTGGDTRFDGTWLVTISCPNNTERTAARGYRYQFPAEVSAGVLRGGRGSEDQPGSLHIEGPIGADGHALFEARGRTGDPDFAVQHPPPSSPYGFHVDAQFEGGRGRGRRLEQRVCDFVFERR
jgi:hypothetical protein